MRGGALFNGKEGRGDFRKKLPLAKDFANERNESLLSNCRVQLILSKGRRRDSKDSFFNGKPLISKAIPKLTAYPHFSYFIPGYITNTAYQAYCKQLHFSVYFTLLFNLLDKYQIKVH